MSGDTKKTPDTLLVNIINEMTPEAVGNLKRMIELGKKPDGRKLSRQEKEACMEAIVCWEAKHLERTQRSGYIEQRCAKKASIQ